MITSIGNNFGAPRIEFKDYQDDNVVILNGSFQYDPTSEAYIKADVLNVYLPDFSISKSSETSVFLLSAEPEHRYGTIIKSWIQDKNTLCFEKVDYFDHYGEVTIYICSAYPKLGYRGTLTQSEARPITLATITGSVDSDMKLIYLKEKWCYMFIGFTDFYNSNTNGYVSFTIDELPEGLSAEFPIVTKQASVTANGQAFAILTIQNKTVTCTKLPSDCNNANDGDFLKAYLIY